MAPVSANPLVESIPADLCSDDALLAVLPVLFPRPEVSRFVRRTATRAFTTHDFERLPKEWHEADIARDVARFIRRHPRLTLLPPLPLAEELHDSAIPPDDPARQEEAQATPLTLLSEAEAAPRAARPTRTPLGFREGYTLIPVNHAMRAIRSAFYRADQADAWSDHGGETVPTCTIPVNKGQGAFHVSLRPDGPYQLTPDVLAALHAQVRALGDAAIDTLDSCLAICLAQGGGEDAPVWVTPEDILEARGIEPIRHRGDGRKHRHGYRLEDLQAVGRTLAQLDQVWLAPDNVLVIPAKGKRLTWQESRLLVMTDRVVEQDERGRRVYRAVRVLPGEWIRAYRQVGLRQTGLLPRQVLRYDPYHGTLPKRLGRYFHEIFRMDAKRQGAAKTYTVATLLDRVGRLPDRRNPDTRTRKPFEQALDRLRDDGVIAGWAYTGDRASLPSKLWLPLWLTMTVAVTPPAAVARYPVRARGTASA